MSTFAARPEAFRSESVPESEGRYALTALGRAVLAEAAPSSPGAASGARAMLGVRRARRSRRRLHGLLQRSELREQGST